MKLNSNDPIGLVINQIFIDNTTGDKVLKDSQRQANQAISHFSNMNGTPENCQRLQAYFKEYQARCVARPESDAKKELIGVFDNLIELLQTGIDQHSGYEAHSGSGASYEPKKDDKYKGWKSFSEQYQKAVEQYQANGYRNIPIVWDRTKLEGFIRNIPGIKGMDIFEFFKMYFYDQLLNFVKPTPAESKVIRNGGSSEKYIDRAAQICAKRFAFVQLTSVTQIVIENRYPEAEEMFTIIEER